MTKRRTKRRYVHPGDIVCVTVVYNINLWSRPASEFGFWGGEIACRLNQTQVAIVISTNGGGDDDLMPAQICVLGPEGFGWCYPHTLRFV